MNNFLLTVDSYFPVISRRGAKVIKETLNRMIELFSKNISRKGKNPVSTNQYKEIIKSILLDGDDVAKKIDDTIELIKKDIEKVGLDTEIGQDLAFKKIVLFIEDLYSYLRTNYLFNTISTNKPIDFDKKSIGEQVNDIILKKNGKIDGNNKGYCCQHFALLFKHLFDEFEKIGVRISSCFFMEKTDGLNHVGLIVTFKGKNYLIDTLYKNIVQSTENLGEDRQKRMKPLIGLCRDDISDDTELLINQYIQSDEEYHKIAVKDAGQLSSVLSAAPENSGLIIQDPLNAPIMNNSIGYIYDILLGIKIMFLNNGILVSNNIFYHFYPLFSEEELNKIEDDQLIPELIKRISYKTNGRRKETEQKHIKVFDYEKEHLLKNLTYFSDKIDYTILRRILLNSPTV